MRDFFQYFQSLEQRIQLAGLGREKDKISNHKGASPMLCYESHFAHAVCDASS